MLPLHLAQSSLYEFLGVAACGIYVPGDAEACIKAIDQVGQG